MLWASCLTWSAEAEILPNFKHHHSIIKGDNNQLYISSRVGITKKIPRKSSLVLHGSSSGLDRLHTCRHQVTSIEHLRRDDRMEQWLHEAETGNIPDGSKKCIPLWWACTLRSSQSIEAKLSQQLTELWWTCYARVDVNASKTQHLPAICELEGSLPCAQAPGVRVQLQSEAIT